MVGIRATLKDVAVYVPAVPTTLDVARRGLYLIGSVPLGEFTDKELNQIAECWRIALLDTASQQRAGRMVDEQK